MHRSRSWRSRAERLTALVLNLWVAWAVWWVIWQLARMVPSWGFAPAGAIFIVTCKAIGERARVVRLAQDRSRFYVLPLHHGSVTEPDDRDGGGAAPGGRLGLPGNGNPGGEGQ